MPSVISNSYLQPCEIHCLVTFLLTVSCRVQTSCTRQPHFLTHQTLVSRRQALTLLVVCSILAFCKLFKPGPAGIGCVQKLLILWSEWSITEEDSGMVYGPQPEAAHIIQGGLANVATNAMVSKQMQMQGSRSKCRWNGLGACKPIQCLLQIKRGRQVLCSFEMWVDANANA